jgi:ABC-2 type transport system ATP-binding protein
MSVIEINNITKFYGKDIGVENISLKVEAGEIYGFIGKNGAGKSTTIRLLLNLIFPTSGNATIMGYDCVNDSKKIKEFLSYVPSEVEYYPNMKVIDLLNYSLLLSGNKNKERINELCSFFELEKNRLISELSLGNRKKVSIIQSLLKNPKVIILDEPTSGLDPLMQDKLFKILLEEKAKGACVFLSSHNLSEVEKYCDRVCVIKEGKVVEIDSMENLNKKRKIKVTYKTVDGEQITNIYKGDINELIKKLAKMNLKELEIRHTSLEEDFIKHYMEDNK